MENDIKTQIHEEIKQIVTRIGIGMTKQYVESHDDMFLYYCACNGYGEMVANALRLIPHYLYMTKDNTLVIDDDTHRDILIEASEILDEYYEREA